MRKDDRKRLSLGVKKYLIAFHTQDAALMMGAAVDLMEFGRHRFLIGIEKFWLESKIRVATVNGVKNKLFDDWTKEIREREESFERDNYL